MNCIGAKPVKGDLSITIDKLSIYIYVYGDVNERCESLFKKVNPKPDLAISSLKSTKVKPIALPKTNERLTIGRSKDCNILIPNDPSVSRIHAHVVIRDKCLFLVDNKSHNKTYVNLKPINKISVLPGDIIEFGDSAYLLHYQSS